MSRSGGFTLFEALLTIVLLVAVFFPLVQMLQSELLASEDVKGSNTAAYLAQEKIEMDKNLGYASISSETLTAVPSYPAYQRSVTVSTPVTNLKDILVTVIWTVGGKSTMYLTAETYDSNF